MVILLPRILGSGTCDVPGGPGAVQQDHPELCGELHLDIKPAHPTLTEHRLPATPDSRGPVLRQTGSGPDLGPSQIGRGVGDASLQRGGRGHCGTGQKSPGGRAPIRPMKLRLWVPTTTCAPADQTAAAALAQRAVWMGHHGACLHQRLQVSQPGGLPVDSSGGRRHDQPDKGGDGVSFSTAAAAARSSRRPLVQLPMNT